LMSLNIGRYIATTMPPTMPPITTIITSSMIDVACPPRRRPRPHEQRSWWRSSGLGLLAHRDHLHDHRREDTGALERGGHRLARIDSARP
jgi:hypothetical protein